MGSFFDTVLGIDIARLDDGVLYEVRQGERRLGRGTLPFCERRRLELLYGRHGEGRTNVPFPTLGGKQLWADVFVHGGWRIQESVVTDIHRLLDASNRRQAWGTYAECRTAFERARLERRVRASSPHAVVLLHGLARSSDSLRRLSRALEAAGYEVISVNYPSTRRPIDEHAKQLLLVMERLREVERVSFVTHSMGALIVRAMLAMRGPQPWRERIGLERILMIFPPSRGAAVAAQWKDTRLGRIVMGPPLSEIGSEEVATIPAPPCPFGIIAGTKDRRVKLDEAWLTGCEAFLPLPIGHTLGLLQPVLVEAVIRYIDIGELSS